LSIRLMASLLYLKHAFNLSDGELVERWTENAVWQFLSGNEYYEPRPPGDATQIGRFLSASSLRGFTVAGLNPQGANLRADGWRLCSGA